MPEANNFEPCLNCNVQT